MTTLSIIFAKEPVPGQVKTRLSPPLRPEDACRLYHCFIEDILEGMTRLPGMELALAYAPAGARDFFRHLAPAPVRLVPQEGPDLGNARPGPLPGASPPASRPFCSGAAIPRTCPAPFCLRPRKNWRPDEPRWSWVRPWTAAII